MRASSRGAVAAGTAFWVMVIAALAAPEMSRAAGAPAGKSASPAVIEVGTARSAPGKTVRGYLEVGERSDGTPFRFPVVIVSGRKPGPVVWINALAHGNEYGGARALQETIRRLDPETIAGHVVAVMVSNPAAFQSLQRVNPDPDDLEDMGSAYPGDPGGFATERLVAALHERVRAQADYFIDLHTGGDHFKQHPFVLYTPNPGVPEGRYDDLARSFGVPTLWRDAAGTFKKDGIITFSTAGIPSFLLEVGGEPLDPADVRLQTDAVISFLAGAGVMAGPSRRLASYTIVTGYRIVTNSRGGFFEATARPGDRVRSGDPLGTIRDVFGDVVETLRAPSGAEIVLGIATYPAVPTGGWVVEVGTGVKESP
jgi:predicted deacylase